MAERIGLTEAVEALRSELATAVERASDAEIQFPVLGAEFEFHVGVTWETAGGGKARFWVLELGTEVGRTSESTHTLRVTLGPPVDRAGEVVKVTRRLRTEP